MTKPKEETVWGFQKKRKRYCMSGLAMAAVRIKNDFAGLAASETEAIRARALELLLTHNREMAQKYAS